MTFISMRFFNSYSVYNCKLKSVVLIMPDYYYFANSLLQITINIRLNSKHEFDYVTILNRSI